MENKENNNSIYNKLLKLQCLLKKESSLKDLCKKKKILLRYNI